jgi:hypothetical protein
MRIPSFLGLGMGAFGAIAIACTLSTPPPPDQTVTEFCNDYAQALCQLATSCQFDATACTTFQTGQCMTNVGAQQGGTRAYSQQNGKQCIDLLNSKYGGNPTSISATDLASIQAICGKVVVGDVASNKPCTGDNDCANGLTCAPYGTTMLCANVTQKNLGDPCVDPGDQCQGDSYCAPQPGGAPPECVATPATGAACSAGITCGSSDHCVGGTCQARGDLSAPCATNDDCSSSAPYCDTYPPAACTTGLTFGRGSADCRGIAGTNEPGATGDDGGGNVSTEAGE